jgi:hypothetical protein
MATLPPIDDPDYPDPIVEEVRAIRRRMDAEYGYDLRRLFDDLRRRERESGRTYVSFTEATGQPVVEPPLASDSAVPMESR